MESGLLGFDPENQTINILFNKLHCSCIVTSDFHSTGMAEKVNTRLREIVLAARGSQDAGSRNLGHAFYTIPLQTK